MNARMQKAVREIITDVETMVKEFAEAVETVRDPRGAEQFERELRKAGQSLVMGMLEKLLQANLDGQPAVRVCPRCGGCWHNKGRRKRGLLSSVGGITLYAPYRYCAECGYGRHDVERLARASTSGPMRELLCTLGVALASFDKASQASGKLLGVHVSKELIRTLCRQEGHQAQRRPALPPVVAKDTNLTGSCDGTMVHTREDSWKEVKAFLFECEAGTHGGAYLERSKQFAPRLREAAAAMHANQAGEVFWVSDAAEWIDRAVAVQLPRAVRIVDIWHAYEHIHKASRLIHGEGTKQAASWGQAWCEELRLRGGREVWRRLGHSRYQDAERQAALEELLGYLDRQAARMDYPTYTRKGWPISSGPMESFCKQLGARLKGPGMRWCKANVDPMAQLVSLWSTGQWTAYWT